MEEQKDTKPDSSATKINTEGAKKKSRTSAKTERPTNCPVCKKRMKNKWYYRNGKYFCCKGCWKQEKLNSEKAKEEKHDK